MRRILVAVDGSDHARRAVEFAADLAACFRSGVTVLHVVEDVSGMVPPEFEAYARIEHVRVTHEQVLLDAGQRIVSDAEKTLRDRGVSGVEQVVEIGRPAFGIAEKARELDADMIVMGRRGLGNLASLLQGSVTHKVMQLADTTVVTVK